MSESRAETSARNSQSTQSSNRSDSSAGKEFPGLLMESGQGKTVIADGVVAKIAGIAAREVDGVHDLVPIGAGGTIAGFATRLTRGDQRATGVNVEVGQREAAVDLNMMVNYGINIPQLAKDVRQNIISRVDEMTGLTVKEVNINVADLFFPEDAQKQQSRVQ